MDPITLFLIVALAGFVVFQVFQGRKRKRETEERVSKFVPGVEIMTNYGLYGTIVEVDDERNLVTLEVSPGVEVKIHKQTMLKVADYNDNLAADVNDENDEDDEASDVDVRDSDTNTDLKADAEITTGKDSRGAGAPTSTSTTSSPTTPAFSAADPDLVTEPAPAYGERVVPAASATPSVTGEADAAVEPVAPKTTGTRTPRKPATPRTTPARSTTPRTTTPRTPRASTAKSATPPADDTSSDSQSN